MELDEKFIKDNLSIFDEEPIKLQMIVTNKKGLDYESALRMHKTEILSCIIYSIQNYSPNILGADGKVLYTISGFVEQKNRLPIDINEIKIIRGENYFSVKNENIISEIGFIIRRDVL